MGDWIAPHLPAADDGLGALIRRHDWSEIALGIPAAWPQPLRTLVDVMLGSSQPMFVAWGPERTLLYNDAYARILATKHPDALGRPFLDVWHEIRDDLVPIVDQAFAGQSVQMDDITLHMERNGYLEETHFAFSYTPVRDEGGAVVGLFCACSETTGQVLAKRRMAAERERLHLLLRQMPGFVALLAGPAHVFEYVNDAYVTIAGPRQFIGRTVHEVFPELDGQGYFELLDEVYATGRPFAARAMPIRLAGEETDRFIDFLYHPIRDATGAVTGVFVGGYDITERIRAEGLLRAERDRARGVLDGMNESFALLGWDFRILDLNAEAMRLETRPREAIIGRTHWEAYPGSEDSELGHLYRRAMVQRIPVALEHRYVWPDGRAAWLDMRAYPVADGLAIFYRDVTDRQRVEAEARAATERIQLALDAGAIVGTWVWDVPSNRFVADDRFAYSFGLVPGRCRTGLPLDQVTAAVHDEDRPRVAEAIAEALKRGGSYRCAYRVRRHDGVFRWIEANGRVELDPDGAPLRFPGVLIDIDERRRLEAERDRAAQLLRTLMEAVPGVVYAKDRLGRMLVANRGAAELIGKPPEAFIGKTDAEFLDDPAQGAAIMATDRRIMDSGVAEQVEEPVSRPDGTLAFWLSTKAPLRDPAGSVVGLIGSSVDVTERRKLEARRFALVELTDRLRDRDDPADLAYAATEILGRTLGVSRAGYGAVDPVAETITIERDWNAPGIRSLAGVRHLRDYGSYIDDLKRGETVVFADAASDPRTTATAAALTAIGARSVVNMPITEQGGLVALLYLNHATVRAWTVEELAFIRDVAERTRTAVQRRRAEADLRALATSLERQVEARTAERDRVWRNSRDLLAVIGADGVFRAVNPAWETILGHSPVEIVGHSFHEFVWPEDAALTQDGLERAAARHDLTNFENRYRHRDGTPRWISWHSSVEGDVIYAYGRDITAAREQAQALAQVEEALRQSQKMEAVGQLTGGIAHDFNNMLAVVIGSLDLLGRRLGSADPRARRYVDAATEGARRAAVLTQRLLAFSRQQPLRPEPVDANRLVAGMSDLLRHALGADIRLETVLAGGLWRSHADPNQLENTILNLAVNARDAMPGGGRLTIETQNAHLDARYAAAHLGVAAGQYVLIAVTDTGTGMAAEVIARAFDPFFTTKEVGRGTGLGLSQVYGFVKQSGGHVKIYSEPGQGTTVKVYLPRLIGAEQDMAAEEQDAEVPLGDRREVVLVVEDEPAVRAFSVDALTELGYRVLEADGAAAALRLLEAHPEIALLFTDIVMPDINGRKLADEALRRRPELKVLFTTGYTRNAVVHNGVLDPGVELIGKPFTLEELAAKVRAVLDDQP